MLVLHLLIWVSMQQEVHMFMARLDMVAGFMPIFWISRAVIHVLVLMVETTAFTTRKAVYYTVGTRVRL